MLAWSPQYHLKSAARQSSGKAAKTGQAAELSLRNTAGSPQNSPRCSFLIGFNYFPFNCISKALPVGFLIWDLSSPLGRGPAMGHGHTKPRGSLRGWWGSVPGRRLEPGAASVPPWAHRRVSHPLEGPAHLSVPCSTCNLTATASLSTHPLTSPTQASPSLATFPLSLNPTSDYVSLPRARTDPIPTLQKRCSSPAFPSPNPSPLCAPAILSLCRFPACPGSSPLSTSSWFMNTWDIPSRHMLVTS